MNAPLRIDNLRAWYGAAQVLHGVNLCIGEGEVVALVGRNGSGRSTLAKAIMGLVRCAGDMRYRDVQLVGLRPHRIARLGIGYVPETRDVFPALTRARKSLARREERHALFAGRCVSLVPRARRTRVGESGGVIGRRTADACARTHVDGRSVARRHRRTRRRARAASARASGRVPRDVARTRGRDAADRRAIDDRAACSTRASR